MNGIDYEVPHCGEFSTPYYHPSWAQIFRIRQRPAQINADDASMMVRGLDV